mmetsp:Transcript_22272/g.30629  ORF Transcript_22272/g.30629 Transcript_22272/m.30629 type:complete len:414 (+) Transcript_22272:119-1360(+)
MNRKVHFETSFLCFVLLFLVGFVTAEHEISWYHQTFFAPAQLHEPPFVYQDVDFPSADLILNVSTNCQGIGFILEDWLVLGHFQMSLLSLFSYLIDHESELLLSQRKRIRKGHQNVDNIRPSLTVLLSRNSPHRHASTEYYGELITAMMRYFIDRKGLDILFDMNQTFPLQKDYTFDVFSHSRPTQRCFAALYTRTCQLPNGDVGRGSCGAWFSSPEAVESFRDFLEKEFQISTNTSSSLVPQKSFVNDVRSILVYNRALKRRRTMKNTETVVEIVKDAIKNEKIREEEGQTKVDFYQYVDERSFVRQCQLFNGYDMIVMAHGAAMSNLICTRKHARIIEIGISWSMFEPLVHQLENSYCHVKGAALVGQAMSPRPEELSNCVRELLSIGSPSPYPSKTRSTSSRKKKFSRNR